MAKTTNHSKSATAKKSEITRSVAPDGAVDIRMMLLDQLEPSQLNGIRLAANAKDEAELFASNRETGIKQKPVIRVYGRRILLSMPVDVGSKLCSSSQRIACFRQMWDGRLRDLIEMLHERLRSGTVNDAFRNAHSVFGEAPCPTAPHESH